MPVAWNAVGGGSKPPPGWGFSRACACTSMKSSPRHQRAFRQAEDRARDDQALDLARPLVDLRDLRVAVVPLDRELLGVAVPAEDLNRFGRLAAGHLRREELRLRTLLGVAAPFLLQPRCPVDEQTGSIDLHGHVGQLVLDRLEVRDAMAEGTPLSRIGPRHVIAGLRDAECLRCDTDAAAVERAHRDAEAAVLLVEQAIPPYLGALDHDVV